MHHEEEAERRADLVKSNTIKVRLRVPHAPAMQEVELDEDAPWSAVLLHFESISGVDNNKIRVLRGYPPKPIEAAPDAPVCSLGLRTNDTLIVQEGTARVQAGANTGQKYARPVSERAHLVRRVCPGDNSCLFHACAYVLRDKSRTDGPLLRQQCVEAVLARPDMFNQDTIGQSTEAYAAWLSRSDSWGGAIELQILSSLYKTEIIALDLESTTMQRFGSDEGYTVRAFVVYTGNHFDCIAMNPQYNSDTEHDDQVLFNPNDDTILARTRRFVKEEGEQLGKERATGKKTT